MIIFFTPGKIYKIHFNLTTAGEEAKGKKNQKDDD